MQKNKTIFKRVLSVFLAVLVLVLCIPAGALDASAWGFWPSWGGGFGRPGWTTTPDVMTNVGVQFQDTKYKKTKEQETGQLFYLYLSLAGSNVYHYGTTTTYSIDISDSNLLLPNFAGNGLINGSYNGFKLTVTKDASGNITKRTITYKIANGQTKAIWLQAKFANGTTPDGTNVKATVTASGSTTVKSTDVTAKSEIVWDDSKSANPATIQLAQLQSGLPINYTLKAYPSYTSDKKGEWWVDAVKMTDTITLPAGLEFDGTPTTSNLSDYITLPGDVEVTSVVANSASSITVSWIKNSANTKSEMAPCTVNLTLNTSKLKAASDFAGGTIDNVLDVQVIGIGSDAWVDLPDRSAAVTIPTPPAPPEPAPAKIDLIKTTKELAGAEAGTSTPEYGSYLTPGEYVLFEIYAKNSGDIKKDGPLTLTDVVPNELEVVTGVAVDGKTTDGIVSGQNVTWTIQNGLASGEDFTGYVVCKVRDTITGYQTLTNTVYLGTPEDYESVARAYVTVKVPSASYSISKSVDKQIYTIGDTLTYTIRVTNTGEEDITFTSISDVFNSASSVDITSSDLPTGSFTVEKQSYKEFKVVATVTENAAGDIENTVTANPEDLEPQSAKAIVYENAFDFGPGGFTKHASSSTANVGGTVSYTLKYANNTRFSGTFEKNPLIFTDTMPAGLKITSVTLKGQTLTEGTSVTATTKSAAGTYTYTDGVLTASYADKIDAYESVELIINCEVEDTAGDM